MAAHWFFALGLNHDAGQGFSSAVADDHAASIFQLFFRGADSGGDCRNAVKRALFADLYVDDDLRKDFEIRSKVVDGFAAARHEIEDHEGGENSVAGGGQVREQDVAGLFAAQGRILFLHFFEHVAVSYGGPEHANSRALESGLK